jgi:galactokinase
MAPTFADLYGGPPAVTAAAPGRVNLIGEHTDYNDGFVLPAALPLKTTVELAPREDPMVRVWSAEFQEQRPQTFSIDRIVHAHDWTDYVRGMAWVLVERGLQRGFDVRVSSQMAAGSGLSSSAALLIAAGRAMRAAFKLSIDDVQLAQLARQAETGFVGAPVGIMDQMACSLADESSALFIDTRSLHYERIALPLGSPLLVIDSGVRHSHVSGEYRTRRDECARAGCARRQQPARSQRRRPECDRLALQTAQSTRPPCRHRRRTRPGDRRRPACGRLDRSRTTVLCLACFDA